MDPMDLDRLEKVVYWNRWKTTLLALLLGWLMIEVYDIWPDKDFDPEHVETVLHFIEDNAQVAVAFIGMIGLIFTNVMQYLSQKK